MEFGRSAPMLMSASPGRAAAMVPAPVEGSQLRGHRQRTPNSAAPTVGALSRARSALRSSGSETSAEFGSVNRLSRPHARARGSSQQFKYAALAGLRVSQKRLVSAPVR